MATGDYKVLKQLPNYHLFIPYIGQSSFAVNSMWDMTYGGDQYFPELVNVVEHSVV